MSEAYEELVDALGRIAHLRPVGDVNACKQPKMLVKMMEKIALQALAKARATPPAEPRKGEYNG